MFTANVALIKSENWLAVYKGETHVLQATSKWAKQSRRRVATADHVGGKRVPEVNFSSGCRRPLENSELKIRRRRDSTTADLVEGAWGEVAVAMAQKIALRKLARRRVVVAPFPVEV